MSNGPLPIGEVLSIAHDLLSLAQLMTVHPDHPGDRWGRALTAISFRTSKLRDLHFPRPGDGATAPGAPSEQEG